MASCDACYTRHTFSKKEAQQPQACQTCHMGFDHPQWEMYSASKHGVRYLLKQSNVLPAGTPAPKCQTCHMKLRLQVWVELRQNEQLFQCESCNRILYYEPPPPTVSPRARSGEGRFELSSAQFLSEARLARSARSHNIRRIWNSIDLFAVDGSRGGNCE